MEAVTRNQHLGFSVFVGGGGGGGRSGGGGGGGDEGFVVGACAPTFSIVSEIHWEYDSEFKKMNKSEK